MKFSHHSALPDAHSESKIIDHLDLRRLQTFVLAAKTQSFSTVAQSLNIVPSAVSHGIKSLEEELGCELFLRKGPKITLTRAGRCLVPYAIEIINRVHDLHHAAKSIQHHNETLRLAAPESFCSRLLPAVMPDFIDCLPNVTLTIHPINSTSLVCEMLENGTADIVFSPSEIADSSMESKELLSETLELYASSAHPLCSTQPLQIAELKQHLIFVVDQDAANILASYLDESYDASSSHIQVMNSVESIEQMTRATQSIAMIPDWIIQGSRFSHPSHFTKLNALQHQRHWLAHWKETHTPSWSAEVLFGLIELHISELRERAAGRIPDDSSLN